MSLSNRICLPLVSLAFVLTGPSAIGAGRRVVSLNGDWNFVVDPQGSLQVTDLASRPNIVPTRVPSSWQAQFPELRDYAGVAWYFRAVTLEALAPDQVVVIRFGAVDYLADVFVNEQKAGSHEGGYLPFEFDVTALVKPGENQVAVRVVDPGAKPRDEVAGIRYAEIPHGKQNWYVQTSGLWQDVTLEIRPRLHFGAVHITASAQGRFKIEAPLANPPATADSKERVQVKAEILDPGENVVWQETREAELGKMQCEFVGQIASPRLWNLDDPALYTLRVSLSSGDVRSERFGFRNFEARDGKFYLNGKVIYIRGALDQDFYPDTIYAPPSLDYLRDQARKAKALGLNMLRCHIKVPDPRYLQAADEEGLLVWYEIPNWDKLTEDAKRRAWETLRGMIDRDWNHPSIVVVSIINESWGVDLKEASQREWLKRVYYDAKKIVPNWLVVDNSACCENFHMATDIADFHQYNAIPDFAADFDRFVGDMATRARWLFSPYGDAEPRGSEPLVLSEFGNWGLPKLPESIPWWFSRDFMGIDITKPAGVEKRFADFQYGSLFPDFNALAEATQWHQFRALKTEIESLRVRPEIEGYVITEFTDLNWEANGLLDMWRQPKAYHASLANLQQDDLLIAVVEKRNLGPGASAADIYFSHYGTGSVAGAQINWTLEGTALRGSLPVSAPPPGTAAKVGRIEFTVPNVKAPTKTALKIQLVAEGKTVGENSVDLFIYPETFPVLPPSVSFHDPAGRLRRLVNEMRARNYQAPSGSEKFPVMIASVFDDQATKTLNAGGRVILLTSDKQTLAPGLEIVPRAGSRLDGNWITGFTWVRKDQEPFKRIGFDTLAGFEIQALAPSAVVQGVPAEHFRDVLAGIFYGWIHSNVGALVQAKYGKGILLICTFSLGTSYGSDPYATYLLDALVNYGVSGLAPEFEIPSAVQ